MPSMGSPSPPSGRRSAESSPVPEAQPSQDASRLPEHGRGHLRPPFAEKLRTWLPTVAFLVAVLCARASLADHYVVPTGSMEPTVHVGDRILVNKAAFGWRVPLTEFRPFGLQPPELGDVVVIEPPTGEGPVLLKRVVALPGDEVQVTRGRLILNGQHVSVLPSVHGMVEELGTPHQVRLTHGGGRDFGPHIVPAGRMLVMGDNRGNSLDGRSFGFVTLASCLGRAQVVYRRAGEWTWQEL